MKNYCSLMMKKKDEEKSEEECGDSGEDEMDLEQ